QFIKSPKEYGEIKAAKSLGNFEIRSMGKGFPSEAGTGSLHERAAKDAWGYFLSTMEKGVYGFVVLDEINIALKYAYVDIGEVKGLLMDLKRFKGLVLTGRYADGSLYPYVDQILEMREIKHPYHKGIKARRGIEF
ncbi:MAG: cob(I)yrinic acid a,c-diamide adenosyltransferase, partial [Desulfatiglandales bacterium]